MGRAISLTHRMSFPRSPPSPPSSAVSARMSRIPGRDTAPEIALRRIVHARGLRYFVDRQPLQSLRRRADLVFPRLQIAVFVDGCFWHGCPDHGNRPQHNGEWWKQKIHRNRARDADTDGQLAQAGWTVIRAWEHDDPYDIADRIADAVQRAHSRGLAPAPHVRR